MELVDKLREESSSEHVAYTEFILKLKGNTDGLFCFFEGKDDNKYYGIRIKNITQEEYEHVSCGGKENVIKVYELISSKPEYKDIKVSFFVDSDYQEVLQNSSIYCLPSYSIESQYVKLDALKRVLKSEFQAKEGSEDFEKIVSFYNSLLSDFLENTLLINSWLACQSDKRQELGTKTYLKVDSTIGKFFKSMINNEINAVSKFEELDEVSKLNSYFPKAPPISQEEIDERIKSFKGVDQAATFRGKFVFAFFIEFLNRLQSEIGKKIPTLFKKRHKCSLRFEMPSALTTLSIYAETPKCLVSYLEQFKKAA